MRPVRAQATQVVGHPAGGDRGRVEAHQASERLAQVRGGEATDLEDEEDEGGQESLSTGVVEAQTRGDLGEVVLAPLRRIEATPGLPPHHASSV